jgi:hypothetical protein
LLLQYLFQCNCPVASEEARYPEQVDVIVPACRYVTTRLSPSGQLLYIREKRLWSTQAHLLDLQTNEKITSTLPDSDFYFLTDDLLYVSYRGEEYILNRTTGDQYPIQSFRALRPDAYANSDVNLKLLAEALRRGKYVFLINDNDTVIALASDFPASSDHSFITGWFDIPGFGADRVEQFLGENGIVYQFIPANFPGEVLSPDGRFVARADGIYLVETGQKIVEGYSSSRFFRPHSGKYFAVRGWTSDGTGVIYSKFLNPCLIETNFIILDDPACFIEVPQPVIKLKMPEEYLLSQKTP